MQTKCLQSISRCAVIGARKRISHRRKHENIAELSALAQAVAVGKSPAVLEACGADAVMPKESFLEARFALHLRAANLPPCVREYCFDDVRKWRFDFAWPEYKIAVEPEGKKHTIGAQHEKDCEKFVHAVLADWRVLRVTYKQVMSLQALEWTSQLLKQQGAMK